MKQAVTAIILGILLTGCGARKRTAERPREVVTVREEVPKPVEKTSAGSYILPEDTGEFIQFEIASVEEYIETFAEIAQFEMKAYGIPASITLAQGIVESGFGRGELTLKTNNHFGIKCHTGWEGQFDHHDDDEIGECFRKYNHPMYSFRDHSIFLSSRSRYASLFELRKDDYKGWARGLKAAGYATDKRYPHKLIDFIERYQLYQYDRGDVVAGYPREKPRAAHDYKVHVVRQGDTLYSLSKRYLVSVDELMELNRMNDSKLSIGQTLRIKQDKIR